jgi:hypothetical protein
VEHPEPAHELDEDPDRARELGWWRATAISAFTVVLALAVGGVVRGIIAAI